MIDPNQVLALLVEYTGKLSSEIRGRDTLLSVFGVATAGFCLLLWGLSHITEDQLIFPLVSFTLVLVFVTFLLNIKAKRMWGRLEWLTGTLSKVVREGSCRYEHSDLAKGTKLELDIRLGEAERALEAASRLLSKGALERIEIWMRVSSKRSAN